MAHWVQLKALPQARKIAAARAATGIRTAQRLTMRRRRSTGERCESRSRGIGVGIGLGAISGARGGAVMVLIDGGGSGSGPCGKHGRGGARTRSADAPWNTGL